jgi:hypothetical protein
MVQVLAKKREYIFQVKTASKEHEVKFVLTPCGLDESTTTYLFFSKSVKMRKYIHKK